MAGRATRRAANGSGSNRTARAQSYSDLPGPTRPAGVSAETPAGRCSSGSASDGPAAHTGWDELGIPTVRHDCDRSGRVLSRHGNDAERARRSTGAAARAKPTAPPPPRPQIPGAHRPGQADEPSRRHMQLHPGRPAVRSAACPAAARSARGRADRGRGTRASHGRKRQAPSWRYTRPVNAAASRRRPRWITGQMYRRWQTARSAASDVTPPGHRRGQFPLPPPPPSPFPLPLPSPWPWGLSAPVTTTWLPAATWPLGCTDTTVPGSC
jgi:hypothetical protein